MQAGVSKGAFYLFYASKESLFCKVLCCAQRELCDTAAEMMKKEKSKTCAAKALKWIYRAYDENAFLHGADSGDDEALINKASPELGLKMEESNQRSRQLF